MRKRTNAQTSFLHKIYTQPGASEMPFEVGEAINGLIDAFLNAPIVSTVSKNPLYTAFAITIIIVLILMFVFRDADGNETVLTMSLRSGFWIFLLLTASLLIHNRVLMTETSTAKKVGEYEKVFTPVNGARLHSEYVPVNGVRMGGPLVPQPVPQPLQYQMAAMQPQPAPMPQLQPSLPPAISMPQYSYP